MRCSRRRHDSWMLNSIVNLLCNCITFEKNEITRTSAESPFKVIRIFKSWLWFVCSVGAKNDFLHYLFWLNFSLIQIGFCSSEIQRDRNFNVHVEGINELNSIQLKGDRGTLQSHKNLNFTSFRRFIYSKRRQEIHVKRCASSQTTFSSELHNFSALLGCSPTITVCFIGFVSDDDFDVIFPPLSRSFCRQITTRSDEKEQFVQNHSEESELKFTQVEHEVNSKILF